MKQISEGNGLSLRVQQLTDEIRILKQKNVALSHAVRDFERKEIDQQRRLVDAEKKLREYRT